jgi:hypothetical protein
VNFLRITATDDIEGEVPMKTCAPSLSFTWTAK